jgi:23S rRNA (guanosine2251-2'-O)-methyltransferase
VLGGEQVEGRRAVRELLAAGRRRAHEVWLARGVQPAPLLSEISELATARRVPVRTVEAERLAGAARTSAPQGVLSRADPLVEAELDDLARAVPGRANPFLVVLEGVTDPHNLGAILRTAECAGVSGAVLSRHRAVLVTPTVAKAAAGAIEHMPMAVASSVPAALAQLGSAGVWTVGLDAEGTDDLFDLSLASEPVALVLGAEGPGLSRLARRRCDLVVSIPLLGALPSLNVAAAAAVASYEVARRRAASSG